jgi:hypothetical protein
MQLLHRAKVHDGKEEEDQPEMCHHCGRKLMERQSWLHFHRLKPISDAFVLHGHCLCCEGDNGVCEHREKEGEEKVEEAEENHDVSKDYTYSRASAYLSLFSKWT